MFNSSRWKHDVSNGANELDTGSEWARIFRSNRIYEQQNKENCGRLIRASQRLWPSISSLTHLFRILREQWDPVSKKESQRRHRAVCVSQEALREVTANTDDNGKRGGPRVDSARVRNENDTVSREDINDLKFKNSSYVCSVLPACMCTTCIQCSRSKKRASGCLGRGWQRAVSRRVGAGRGPGPLEEQPAFFPLSHLSFPLTEEVILSSACTMNHV